MSSKKKVQLRCPAGNLDAVRKALDGGADAVYIGFESPTNLRNFKGLNLTYDEARLAVKAAHDVGKELYVVINSYPQKEEVEPAFRAIDDAVGLGVDAVIVSDMANMEYIHDNHPQLAIHLSVQSGSANPETINFFVEQFGINCVVLPRVLTVDEVAYIAANTSVEIEVFALGSLCTSYPGRCNLSQYLSGESTNTKGVCTSPKFLDFKKNQDDSVTVMFNGVALNRVGQEGSVSDCAGHNGAELVQGQGPDGWKNSFVVNKRHVCKGLFLNDTSGHREYALHDCVILNTMPILGKLIQAGVGALKVEGRQRPSLYSADAARIMREAIDLYYAQPENYRVKPEWNEVVARMFPEMAASTGPYLAR